MNTIQSLVREFHTAFGATINDTPTTLNNDDVKQRVSLIQEEAREVIEALESRDVTAIAGELADLIYVAFGAAVACGIDIERVIKKIHEANMRKVWAYDELPTDPGWVMAHEILPVGNTDKRLVYRRWDGKVVKPPSWQKTDLRFELQWQARAAAASADLNPPPAAVVALN